MDFSEKSYIDPAQIAQLAQNQAAKQAQLDQQGQQQKVQMIQQLAQSVGQMVSSSIDARKQKLQQDFLANSLAAKYAPDQMAPQQGPGLPVTPAMGEQSLPQVNGMPQEGPGQPVTPAQGEQSLPPVSTPDYVGQNAIKALVRQDPKKWSDLAAAMYNQTPEQQALTAMNNQKAGLELANTQKINGPVQPSTFDAIDAAYKANDMPAPDHTKFANNTDQQAMAHAKLIADMAKANASNSTGDTRNEIRKQTLITKLAGDFNKDMNPANWSPTTLAGKSAQLKANAESAMNLADQMLSGQIPTTKQTMTSLAMDANRVLSQTTVTSEKITEELQAKTGYASFAGALQYFSAHPEDQRLQPFVQLLKTEVSRQQDQRNQIVDTTLQKNFRKYDKLRELDPKEWEAQINGSGYDVEAAKRGVLKLAKGNTSTIYGGNIGDTSGNFRQTGAKGGKQNDPLGIR